MKQIALLSHRFGNIGHNFMALGAQAAAKEAFGSSVNITHFEQHHPFSIYPQGNILRIIDKIPHGKAAILRRYLGKRSVYQKNWEKISNMDFDLAVACGGPNLVSGAAHTPEMRLMMLHFNGAFKHSGVPLLDAAVGSGFPMERIPEKLSSDDEDFYREAASYTSEISVREPTAARLYKSLGVKTDVVPCIAVGSGRYFEAVGKAVAAKDVSRDLVVINFQEKGSNSDHNQGVDAVEWMNLVRNVIKDLLSAGEKILLLCHSSYELKLARKIAPELQAVFPQTEEQYAKVIMRAKVGFVSRIHAAVALAGIGIPSLVVGNDTRLGTTEQFGLPSIFTKEITREQAVQTILKLIEDKDDEHERLIQLREDTISTYAKKFLKNSRH